MTSQDWQELNKLRAQINSGLTVSSVAEMERFSELFARNLLDTNDIEHADL